MQAVSSDDGLLICLSPLRLVSLALQIAEHSRGPLPLQPHAAHAGPVFILQTEVLRCHSPLFCALLLTAFIYCRLGQTVSWGGKENIQSKIASSSSVLPCWADS